MLARMRAMVDKRYAWTLLLAAAVSAQQVEVEQPEDAPDNDALCRAICERQDQGKLTPAYAVERLAAANEPVARTVAAIVRHEWEELPQEFFDGLSQHPKAAYRFLEELARAPRPAAEQWALGQSEERSKRSHDHRLLALAAVGKPLDKAQAQLVLEALKNEPAGDGIYFASFLLTPKVADGLLGRLHQGFLQDQLKVQDAGPVLDRLSARGTKSLLGLAVTLPKETARGLLRRVYDNRPELVQDRVAAALDGRIPLDPSWLEFANKLLTSKERIARVMDVLRDSDSLEDRDRAFEVLLAAKAVDEAFLKLATDGASQSRIRRIIASAANHLPVSYVIDFLQHSPEVSVEMARALARRPQIEADIQRELLDILDGLDGADSHTPLYAVTALVQGGDAAALKKVWPLVIDNAGWRDQLNRLGRREEPFVYELLLTALDAASKREPLADEGRESVRQSKLDTLRLLLVARGDRRELSTLVANAPKRDFSFVRKCRHYASKLTDEQVQSLFDAALASDDPEVASELLEWIVQAQPEAVAERLWQLWTNPPESDSIEELLEIAMRLLVTGQKREPLLEQLREAIGKGPLPDQLYSLPYEALNSMAEPLHVTDVTLCAEMVLKMPLEDAKGEQRRIRRWPDGTVGFPLIAAIGSRLRKADPLVVEQVFGTLVEELRGDPRAANISRQRLKVFWRSLSFRQDLQRLIGRLTSRLWLFQDAEGPVADGAAVWLQALDAEHVGDYPKAERLYRQAIRELVRLPESRGEARWLLGDRYTAGGEDPIAALAAAPHRMRLLAAKENGDEQAMAAASVLVREFAGHDRETLATLKSITGGQSPESGK